MLSKTAMKGVKSMVGNRQLDWDRRMSVVQLLKDT